MATEKSSTILDRRGFLVAATSLASAGLAARATGASVPNSLPRPSLSSFEPPAGVSASGRLAIEGGRAGARHQAAIEFPWPALLRRRRAARAAGCARPARAPFRWYGIGPKVGSPEKCNLFEKEFAAHQGTKYCVAVTSGTAALITAMAALGVGPGDEVILPAWTWYSCYDAIIAAGATPVFAEIDDSMDLDSRDIERHITPRTKAIMAVHIMGEPADMDPILAIARQHNLRVLEDCAERGRYLPRPRGGLDGRLRNLQLPTMQNDFGRGRRSSRHE